VNKEVGIVLLARLSSSRLPGKALKKIGGRSVLEQIVERLEQVVSRSQIILACSDEASDDRLEEFANEQGLKCYRGSLERVGERFYEAASALDVDFACRMNGDNIFLDPSILSKMIEAAQTDQFDFLSNVYQRTFPKGMSVEIVRMDFYRQQLEKIKTDPYCNEHVMVCLYQDPPPANYFYLYNEELKAAAAIQLALDTEDDWKRSSWMIERMPEKAFDLKTTFDLYQQYEASL
jgi:spore coat polysaccharide biosynthesis protein SpsF